jgi:hypothetical protein
VWYSDLAPCDYFGPEFASCLRAVGWLEKGRAYAIERVQPAVYTRLVELLKDPWQPGSFAGLHICDICLYEGAPGTRNLFVPCGAHVFVCPELVVHYMNAHGYRPPEEFCTAVLACPPMRSVPYLKALLAAARPLVQATT